ncbi:MAG: MFS transporter small subunit [Woeseiaceae bacterium]
MSEQGGSCHRGHNEVGISTHSHCFIRACHEQDYLSDQGLVDGGSRPMNPPETDPCLAREPMLAGPGSGSWVRVTRAWSLVAVPIAWGVWNTLEQAANLFQ